MQIQVNGEARTTEAGTTVADLLRQLDIRGDRVAVELNLEVLDRREFDRRRLCDGDRVEILSFIGGGSSRPGRIECDRQAPGPVSRPIRTIPWTMTVS